MKKLILIILVCVLSSSAYSNENNSYDYIPSKVADGFQISKIAKFDSLNIIAGGGIFISPLPDYIANNGIFKSTDGGYSWTNIQIDTNQLLPDKSRFKYGIEKLEYLSENRILVFYSNGFIRRSEDGGETWLLDSLGTNLSLLDAKFTDKDNGFSSWYISNIEMRLVLEYKRTSNGGKDWIEFNIPKDSLFREDIISIGTTFNILNLDTLFLYGGTITFKNDSIYDSETYRLITTDLGITWKKKFLFKEENLNSNNYNSREYVANIFQFISDDVGYWMGATASKTKFDNAGNAFEYPFLKKTTDGGDNWETLFHDTDSTRRSSMAFEVIDYQNSDNLILRDRYSNILLYNKGEQFYRNVSPRNYSELNKKYGYKNTSDYLRLNNDNIMIASNSEYVFFIDFKNPITSVEDIANQSKFVTYPQPANTNVTIEYDSHKYNLDKQDISIYNIEGQEIKNQDVKINNNSIIWDCSSAQPGIYLINIKQGSEEKSVKVVVE